MSLSQKHAGLILVPWFNSEEWKYVYESIYCKNEERQLKALEWLKIWKLRTPILSAGVEGTLILLEALLLDTNIIPVEQLANIYSIALMRFLNLSAANSEKQGSFTKTSAKNELPKWLINLRHDIAHGHQIPSLNNLKIALDYGLEWLKRRYWEPQSKIITDYYIDEDSTNHLSSCLKAYIEMNVALYEQQELKNDFIENIKSTINKKLNRSLIDPCAVLDILLEIIAQSLEKDRQINLDILISTDGLLRTYFEKNEDGKETLNIGFRNIWQSLLNTFMQHGLALVIIERLFNVISDISYAENCKKMAAVWINELLISLNRLKEPGNEVQFDAKQYNTYVLEAKNFQKRLLVCPNSYLEYFLDSLLKFNSNNNNFNEDAVELLNSQSDIDNMHQEIGKIFTIEELNLEALHYDEVSLKENYFNFHNNGGVIVAGKKWKKIEDTLMFKNCPLGILPNQLRKKHPFLELI
ncbi:unnamed protein product [Ceutorhynchus assimilis]|uniref:LAS1-like protein n=1 Tax=Ceutorhynchus assimilis TaxID=467358 RepID=A0A9N9MRW8_9CUCU|nr:unnamed protein product [Ceutorhynchus assimilis]